MNLIELQRKLINAARANPPSEHVPYAFEKRIMAQVEAQGIDKWAPWAAGLWRAAVPCVAITLVLGAWSFFGAGGAGGLEDLAQEFDNAVLAAAVQQEAAELNW